MWKPGILEVRKALIKTWPGLSLVMFPSILCPISPEPQIPHLQSRNHPLPDFLGFLRVFNPCPLLGAFYVRRALLLFSGPYHRFNRSAMKSVISFSQTCSGCSLVLHNLLAEDTGPRRAVAQWPDMLARVGRSVQQRAAKHGRLRSPDANQPCSPKDGTA